MTVLIFASSNDAFSAPDPSASEGPFAASELLVATLLSLTVCFAAFLAGIAYASKKPAASSLQHTGPDQCYETSLGPQMHKLRRAAIYLVGAGPGNPQYLTQEATALLQSADVVVADKLIPTATLGLATGQVIVARKEKGRAEAAQEEIYHACMHALLQGKTVVRLKGGDPFLYGRGGEEVLRFRRHGFEAVVVPGLSSALTAPLLANVPLTTRGVADQVLIVTGQGRNYSDPSALPEYSPSRTLVILMGVATMKKWCKVLLDRGYPADLAVAIVEKAGTQQQRRITCALGSICETSTMAGVQSPATIVVGHVVSML